MLCECHAHRNTCKNGTCQQVYSLELLILKQLNSYHVTTLKNTVISFFSTNTKCCMITIRMS